MTVADAWNPIGLKLKNSKGYFHAGIESDLLRDMYWIQKQLAQRVLYLLLNKSANSNAALKGRNIYIPQDTLLST